MASVQINQSNFESIVNQSGKKILLDFWAPWCGPCRMVSPILEEIAAEHPEIVVGKINVDEEFELAKQFGIVSIPTMMVMENGSVTQKVIGARPKNAIVSML